MSDKILFDSELIKTIFSKEIIISTINEFLNFSDKKSFSLINPKTNKIFRQSVFKVNIDNTKIQDITQIKKRFVNWNNLTLQNFNHVGQLFKNLESP